MSRYHSAVRILSLLMATATFGCGPSVTPVLSTANSNAPTTLSESTAAPGLSQPESAQMTTSELSPLPPESSAPPSGDPPLRPLIDYEAYEQVLNFGVTEDEGFRYAALHGNDGVRGALNSFITQIGEARPEEHPPGNQLAFYINAYNALVIGSVVHHWPVSSVMRIPGFFDRVRHQIGGRRMTLNELENNVIRSSTFSEPRIHFAVNCASEGCPALAREPYRASRLDFQLNTRTRLFLEQTTRLQARTLKVTKLFEWFIRDFGGREGVRLFLQDHLPPPLAAHARDPNIRIGTFPYDWSINARP